MKFGNGEWKRRWVVLTPDFLAYFNDEFENKPRGLINLSHVESSNGLLNAEVVSDISDKRFNKKFVFELWVKEGILTVINIHMAVMI